MKLALANGFTWSAALLLAGCASAPPTSVSQPMSARPAYVAPENAPPSGSIFRGSVGRSIIEDRRARYVGDILTVNIIEKNTASTKSNTKTARDSSMSAGITAYNDLPLKGVVSGIDLGLKSANEFDGSGESKGENAFTSTITVTVTDVLPNGHLIVSGEKQVAINQGNEFIRFSGVVNPITILAANVVNSSQVADARIEYKSNGYITENQQPGWVSRILLNIMPF